MTTNLPTAEPQLSDRAIGLEKIEYLIVVLETKLERLKTVLDGSSMPEADKHRMMRLAAQIQEMIDDSIGQIEHLRLAWDIDPGREEPS